MTDVACQISAENQGPRALPPNGPFCHARLLSGRISYGNLGLFVRRVRSLEVSNLEVMTEAADARPAFWLMDVDGADFSGFGPRVYRLCRL